MNEKWMMRLIRQRAADDANQQVFADARTGQWMNYGQLYAAVMDTVKKLKDSGIRSGDRVILMMDNCVEFAVTFFAITACGAIVVPVNTGLKKKELAFIIEDVSANGIVMHHMYQDIVADDIAKMDGPDRTRQLFSEVTFLKLQGGESDLDENIAMLMFTSGTTGNPKGVMLQYENLLSKTKDIIEAHALTERDRVLCVLPWFHINGLVITLLTPLVCNMVMIIGGKFSVTRFWQYVQDYQATWFSGVPTMYSHLLARGIPEKNVYQSLRFARSASSALPAAVRTTFAWHSLF